MEPVVFMITIQAKLLSSRQPDPFGSGQLAAAIAHIGFKHGRFLRKRDFRLFHLKQFLRAVALIVGEGFLTAHRLSNRL